MTENLKSPTKEAMGYSLMNGGKRIRPQLCFALLKGYGINPEIGFPICCAIEMIHTYSLIHDDLPALDNDDYRRGKKTAHIVFGEAMAVLAGDALLNYAFEVATKAFDYVDHLEDVARAMKILAKKPGIFGMIGGQVVDVELEGKPLTMEQIEFIHRKKTAALIEASMMIGATLAGAGEGEVQMMKRIGRKIGLAFQIQDDILDVIGDEENLGKPVGSDEKNQKTTYVSLVGLEQAKKDVKKLCDDAMNQIQLFIGEDDFLMDLITYLIDREK